MTLRATPKRSLFRCITLSLLPLGLAACFAEREVIRDTPPPDEAPNAVLRRASDDVLDSGDVEVPGADAALQECAAGAQIYDHGPGGAEVDDGAMITSEDVRPVRAGHWR